MKTAFQLILDFSSTFHHGSGDGIANILDRAFCRDGDGVPFLRASAIKGKFRFGAMRWLLSTEDSALKCKPHEDSFCREDYCLFCQVFGSPRIQGKAYFADAFPKDPEWFRQIAEESPTVLLSSPAEIKSTTAISRRYQRAEGKHLFTTETMPSFLTFHSQIRGELEGSQLELLQQAACLLNHFGADSARGLGFCKYVLEAQ